MNSNAIQMLLSLDDPSPVSVVNADGTSAFLLIGDHAGNRIPAALGTLGLSAADRARHIAWDIGIARLGATLSAELDAVFVHQIYSRLVIDCNRDPSATDAMPEVSDGSTIPGNHKLTADDRADRVAAIHAPYQAAIAAELAKRDAQGSETMLVALHSFTPAMQGFERPWQIGILHSAGNAAFARKLLGLLRQKPELCVGDNEPYAMDSIDYTVPLHAFDIGRPYIEIEIRQDLLATDDQRIYWAKLLATLLPEAASA